jgi:hypothetical protein
MERWLFGGSNGREVVRGLAISGYIIAQYNTHIILLERNFISYHAYRQGARSLSGYENCVSNDLE